MGTGTLRRLREPVPISPVLTRTKRPWGPAAVRFRQFRAKYNAKPARPPEKSGPASGRDRLDPVSPERGDNRPDAEQGVVDHRTPEEKASRGFDVHATTSFIPSSIHSAELRVSSGWLDRNRPDRDRDLVLSERVPGMRQSPRPPERVPPADPSGVRASWPGSRPR
jgi:hypothetical protein